MTLVGRLGDGRAVESATLRSADGVEAEIWSFGAAVRSLRVPGRGGAPVQVLPNPADLASLVADGAYHARCIGRVANRIGGAGFTLDGSAYRTDPNEHGSTLHGGREGWSRQVWRFVSVDSDRCTLGYDSPDGEGGFPGAVEARAHFQVSVQGLTIVWEGRAGAPTPLAMTHHLYFNLSGDEGSDILDHRLTVAASSVTEVDAHLIPTGRLLPVEGTPLDLRAGRRIGDIAVEQHPQLQPGGGLDLNYVLDRGNDAVSLSCPRSGLTMRLSTDQPGCQAYGGQGLQAPMTRYGGVALEPQDFPDAVNQPAFPSVVLRPGATYRRWARYSFVREG